MYPNWYQGKEISIYVDLAAIKYDDTRISLVSSLCNGTHEDQGLGSNHQSGCDDLHYRMLNQGPNHFL